MRQCPLREINVAQCVKVFIASDSCSKPLQILPANPARTPISVPVSGSLTGIFNDPIIRFLREGDEIEGNGLSNTMSGVVSALTKTVGGAVGEVLKGFP